MDQMRGRGIKETYRTIVEDNIKLVNLIKQMNL